MSKGSKKLREEMASRLLEALLARLDRPIELTIPAKDLELAPFDEDWSLLKEFPPVALEDKPDSYTVERLRSTASGTSPISIRVPNRILQLFRQQAEKTGVPYQTLMNRALDEAADAIK